MLGDAGMEPNLFHVDWEHPLEILVVVAVYSFLVKRALAILFEHKHFLKYVGERAS